MSKVLFLIMISEMWLLVVKAGSKTYNSDSILIGQRPSSSIVLEFSLLVAALSQTQVDTSRNK